MSPPSAPASAPQLRRPRAILLDLDDTLINTGEAAEAAWRDVAARFAGELDCTPDRLDATIRDVSERYWSDASRTPNDRLHAHTSRVAVTRLVVDALVPAHPRRDRLAHAMAEHYGPRRLAGLSLYDDTLEALAALRRRGLPLALLSNGDAALQRGKVDRFGLAPWFRTVLIEGEIGYGKPTRRLYERALDACGVIAMDAWCVGDHLEWEVAAPQRLGITGVWIDRSRHGLPLGSDTQPDVIVSSLNELTMRIDALAAPRNRGAT